MNNFVRFISIAAIGIIFFTVPAAAASCESVVSLELPDGKITSAALVAAGEFTPPGGGGSMMMTGGTGVFITTSAFAPTLRLQNIKARAIRMTRPALNVLMWKPGKMISAVIASFDL